jgi:transcriptional regulator with XRE-family HTH domain
MGVNEDTFVVGSNELGQFLMARRAAVEPGEVGLTTRARSRIPGLRREDVAALAQMSPDYYRRLEQGRIGPPSAQILGAVAGALRLTGDERDYLFRVAGREMPPLGGISRIVTTGMRQIVTGLADSAAMVMTTIGETLLQNPLAAALMGDQSGFTGDARQSTYRWFADPSARWMHPPAEHEEESRARVASLRAYAAQTDDPVAARLIGLLRATSPEFERMWQEQIVAICRSGTKTLCHPDVGLIDLDCQILEANGAGQLLVTFTAPAGSPAEKQLRTLAGRPV